MATNYIILPLNGATLPDASGSTNDPAVPVIRVSGGTQTANTPKVTWFEWQFASSQDQHVMWTFRIPGDYSTGGTLRFKWKPDAASTSLCIWKAAVAVSTDGGGTDQNPTFSAIAVVCSTVGVAFQLAEKSIALTMTNAGANDRMTLMFGNFPSTATYTTCSKVFLTDAIFEYTP